MIAKERLRTHHINNFKAYGIKADFEEDAWLSARIRYKVGLPEERELFHDALFRGWEAVVTGNYDDIGENPDVICDRCLNPHCPDSHVVRSGDEPEILFRRKVEALAADECTGIIIFPEEMFDFHCTTIDEIWSGQKA